MVTRRNLIWSLAMGNGPRMSILYMPKGQGEVMLWSTSGACVVGIAEFLTFFAFLTYWAQSVL